MMYIIKVFKKPRFFIAGLLIILTLSIFFMCSTKNYHAAVTTVDIDWYPILSSIFEQRNGFVLKQNKTALESIYLTNERNGLWAYQNELKRSEYLKNWSIKQGVEFISIKSKINIRRSRQVGRGYSFYVVCADEYKYVYKNDPKINAFYLGTYHSLDLIPLDNAWIISREWYDDPLSSTFDAKSIPEGMPLSISSHDQKAVPNLNQNRAAAVEYADSYCGAASPINSNKYNSKYTDYNPLGGDCANFVSQVLYEGGGFKKNSTWNYKDGKGSRTWIKVVPRILCILQMSDNFYMVPQGKVNPCPISLQ